MVTHNAISITDLERGLRSLSTESDASTTATAAIVTSTYNSSNTDNRGQPQLSSHRKREYPPPPPRRPGRFRYSLFVVATYVGLGNCVFFCCLPLLAFENIFRAMGYRQPISFLCAACHVPIATCCLCSCILCKVRRKFRKKMGINGNFILDCLLSLLLYPCVAIQLLTEARAVLVERSKGGG